MVETDAFADRLCGARKRWPDRRQQLLDLACAISYLRGEFQFEILIMLDPAITVVDGGIQRVICISDSAVPGVGSNESGRGT